VGDLKFNRKVWFGGTELRADAMAAQIPVGDRKKVTAGERTQWYFNEEDLAAGVHPCGTIVILWEQWTQERSRF